MGRLPRKPPRLQTPWPPDPLILDNSFSTHDHVPQAEPPNVEPPPKRHKPSTGLRSAVLANTEASLGTYSALFAARLASGVSFDQLCRDQRGSCDIHPNVHQLPHKAARLLSHLGRRGCNVPLSSPPWTTAQNDAAVERGSHTSALQHLEFLEGEFVEMMQKGQWILLPYKSVRGLRHLRLSPLGCIPQRDRRPRTIVDYTFSRLNAETLRLAPGDAMQFGRTLQRILQGIFDADPRFGPVHLIKVDIADGYYRVYINPTDIPKLGVVFPTKAGEEPMVAFPLRLPMGWVESPPYFCAAAETACDLANARLHWDPPPHRLDAEADTPPAPNGPTAVPASCSPAPFPASTPEPPPRLQRRRRLRRTPLAQFDLYVDDYLGAAQGSRKRLQRLRRVLLHSLDEVFRPLDPSDSPYRQEPASVKKLRKGDAYWATRHIILGWLIDTVRLTIELPPHRVERLLAILASIAPDQKRIQVEKWHQLLGELRSMLLGIPGAKGLFSVLQEAFRHQSDNRVRLSSSVHAFLDDFRWLAQDLTSRPTRLAEILPQEPAAVGAVDAAGAGMGGVWFVEPDTPSRPPEPQPAEEPQRVADTDATRLPRSISSPTAPHAVPAARGHAPVLWRQPFPLSIQQQLVSFTNPTGTVTNSDLELAGVIAHQDVLAQTFDIRESTTATLSDNTPAVFWSRKGSTTTMKAPAFLLRLSSLHQRFHRYHPEISHIPGVVNKMADDCSRLWHLSDSQLLAHFNLHYPQALSWRMCHLRAEMNSALTLALSAKPSKPESFLVAPPLPTQPGASGSASVFPSAPTSSSIVAPIPLSSSSSLPSATAMGALPPARDKSDLEQWRTRSVRWARASPEWGPKTLA
jgi:hypothetical protein